MFESVSTVLGSYVSVGRLCNISPYVCKVCKYIIYWECLGMFWERFGVFGNASVAFGGVWERFGAFGAS